jgi:hypothetical protein
MVLPAQVINREPVAQGMLLDGRRFTISNMQYSAPIRGLGDKSVVIDIDAANGLPQEGIGFRSVEDATEYLQSTDVREYQTFDEFGNETVVKRQGMGIPDGLIKQLQEQNPEPQQTQQTNPQSTATVPTETVPTGSVENRTDTPQDQDRETQQNTESSNVQGGPAENF